jgi:hypothetical protein
MRKLWTREELQECFRINEAGELERLIRGLDWRVVECKVNHSDGYCQVQFKDYKIKYHTIIWVLTHGTIVDAEAVIDHIDGNKLNNKIENLRLITNRENGQNRESHRNGRLVGCSLHKCGKWEAQIKINGKRIHLGYYNTEIEAHAVYLKACKLITQYIDNGQFRQLLRED